MTYLGRATILGSQKSKVVNGSVCLAPSYLENKQITGTSHQWKHSVNKLHSKKEHQQIQQDEISKTRQVIITAEPKPSGNKPLILLHAELGTSLPTSLICIASTHAPTLAVIKFETHCPPHRFVYGSPRIAAVLSGLQCFFYELR